MRLQKEGVNRKLTVESVKAKLDSLCSIFWPAIRTQVLAVERGAFEKVRWSLDEFIDRYPDHMSCDFGSVVFRLDLHSSDPEIELTTIRPKFKVTELLDRSDDFKVGEKVTCVKSYGHNPMDVGEEGVVDWVGPIFDTGFGVYSIKVKQHDNKVELYPAEFFVNQAAGLFSMYDTVTEKEHKTHNGCTWLKIYNRDQLIGHRLIGGEKTWEIKNKKGQPTYVLASNTWKSYSEKGVVA